MLFMDTMDGIAKIGEINDWCKSDDNAPINCVVTSISSNRRYVLSDFKGVYTL
jgi:hypothetical protein